MAENVPSLPGTTASVQPSSMHGQRPSFASVAASALMSQQNQTAADVTSSQAGEQSFGKPPTQATSSRRGRIDSEGAALRLDDSLARLDIKDGQVPVPDVLDHELRAPLQIRPRLDDEKTHLSFSSNKAPSLDGKSVASATTFAMDEKESIRPDDSASVKAAEDDDSNSGQASGAANSRVGSDTGGRAFGNQFHEISERMSPGVVRLPAGQRRAVPNVAEELRRGVIGAPLIATSTGPGITRTDSGLAIGSPSFTLPPMPDEKILDAMETPKDRIFLLALEQQVIAFIRDSNDPILTLPPCNSFCRLLAHRLGDYYALGHVLDNSQSAVQLHRTPHCQLRPPLASFETKATPPNGPAATLPSMKIMRRADGNGDGRPENSGTNTTDNSVGPSKAGSEIGSENQRTSGLTSPADSTSTKERGTTREAREAAYKEARERIFAGFKEGESNETSSVDASNDASRASSTNGKKKNKKKTNNNNNDDNFDSRSAYNAYYPTAQRQGAVFEQSNSSMNFYNPYMQPNNGQMFTGHFSQQYGQQYPQIPPASQASTMPQAQGFQMPLQPQQQMMGPSGLYPQPGVQQQFMPYGQQNQQQLPYGQPMQQPMHYGQPMQQSYYPPMQHTNQMAPPLPQSMPSPASSNHSAQLSRPQSQMSDQNWGPNTFQTPYQVYPPQSQYPTQTQHQMIPPNNAPTVPYPFGQLPNSQGSRSTHPIPGSYNRQNQFSNSPNRAPMDPHAFRSSSGYSGGNMNNFAPPQQPHFSPGQQFAPNFNNQHSSPGKPSGNHSQPHSPGQSTLSKWGTPSTLPPKPPPPASSASNHMIGAGAGGVPTFQNGTYSAPSNPTSDNKAPIASQ